MNPTVLSVAFEAYADSAETILRIALHELPPPGQPANPEWKTIKNPVKTILVNAELMVKIGQTFPDNHLPKYMIVLQPNLINLLHILNQVEPTMPLCKMRTVYPVQKCLKTVVSLIKRAYLFPEATKKLDTIIKHPKFSLVFKSPIQELYQPAEQLYNTFLKLREEAGKKLYKEMETFDNVIKAKLQNIDHNAMWAPIPQHFFQFRAPSITLPLVLIDAFFPEVYRFNFDPLPFCLNTTVTDTNTITTNPVSGCTVEVVDMEEDQPTILINGIPKKLDTKRVTANIEIFSQSSEPLFGNSTQSSKTPSPPLKRSKTPSTQTQIANLFTQSPEASWTASDFSQEIKIEPFEG